MNKEALLDEIKTLHELMKRRSEEIADKDAELSEAELIQDMLLDKQAKQHIAIMSYRRMLFHLTRAQWADHTRRDKLTRKATRHCEQTTPQSSNLPSNL